MQFGRSIPDQIGINSEQSVVIANQWVINGNRWQCQTIPSHRLKSESVISRQDLSYLSIEDNISEDLLILLPARVLVTSLQLKSVNEFYKGFLLHAGYYEDLLSRAPPLS
jgi:hypothetical protein